MRLARFILDNLETILQEWEDFARSLTQGSALSIDALRDDAERMLRFVAADMETEQTRQEEMAKSAGLGPALPAGQSSAAEQHGVARAVERFSLVELVAEYRALRASVTRAWIDAAPVTKESVAQIVRFNEGIDQMLADGVAKFTEQLDQEADLFTGSIGHDLSNPLNAVVASARLLSVSRSLSESDRAAVERIERASERLSGMLLDLRDFTRTRLGGLLIVQRELCDVAELVRRVVEELRTVHPSRHIAVACQGTLMLEADGKRISQLLSNLVANALQHSAENGGVQVSARREADAVTIEVHNDGPAIQPELMKRLFDPLSREGPNDNAHLGLGQSSADAGARFTVRLPGED